jgi:hypothetical protein
MDEAAVVEAIKSVIEVLEDTYPAYEVQILVEPGEDAGAYQFDIMAIHRASQLVTRVQEAGDDAGEVLAQATRAMLAKLVAEVGEPDVSPVTVEQDEAHD